MPKKTDRKTDRSDGGNRVHKLPATKGKRIQRDPVVGQSRVSNKRTVEKDDKIRRGSDEH
jgi:hypothetical protein